MELSHEEVEQFIAKIASGKEFIYVDSLEDFVVFEYPNNELRQSAKVIYDSEYKRALKLGLLPMAELEKIIEERGLYTEADKSKVSKLKSQLEAQRVLLSKTIKVQANITRISKLISDLNRQIEEILYKKHSRLVLSAESKSEEARNQYLCWACTYNAQGTLLWKSYKEYFADTDLNFKSFIVNKFIDFLRGQDLAVIRYVARHTLWRIRYTTSMKTSDQLFGRPASSYTNDQLSLAYWSNFYEQVYSMMPEDRPSDEVIDDDTSLDAYMSDYYKELSNDTSVRRKNRAGRTIGNMSAFDKEEVIVTKASELYHEIKYDKPKEAQKVKERTDLKKKTSRKTK